MSHEAEHFFDTELSRVVSTSEAFADQSSVDFPHRPDLPDARSRLKEADSLGRSGHLDQARRVLQELAGSYERVGDDRRALAVWLLSVDLQDAPGARVGAGDACVRLARRGDAMIHFRRAAELLQSRGAKLRLTVVLRRIVQLNPHSARDFEQLGHLSAQLGHRTFGHRCLERAEQLRTRLQTMEEAVVSVGEPASPPPEEGETVAMDPPRIAASDRGPTTRPSSAEAELEIEDWAPDEADKPAASLAASLQSSAGLAQVHEDPAWIDVERSRVSQEVKISDLVQFLAATEAPWLGEEDPDLD